VSTHARFMCSRKDSWNSSVYSPMTLLALCPNTSICRRCPSLIWWHLKPFSSRHCFWHSWQYQRSFCRPLALMRLAIFVFQDGSGRGGGGGGVVVMGLEAAAYANSASLCDTTLTSQHLTSLGDKKPPLLPIAHTAALSCLCAREEGKVACSSTLRLTWTQKQQRAKRATTTTAAPSTLLRLRSCSQ